MISKKEFEHTMISSEYGEDVDTPITCPSNLGSEFIKLETKYCDKENTTCKDCWEGVLKHFNWEVEND